MLSKFSPLKTFFLFPCSLFLLWIEVFSQVYTQDSLAVRAILDSNGLDSISVGTVSKESGGRIVTLNIHNYGLTKLTSKIGVLTGLTNLTLSQNKLTFLPSEIGSLTLLDTLIIYINNLESLPAEIGNLSSLNVLQLFTNSLSTLPAEIGSLSSLEYLDLDDNPIAQLPPAIGNLSSLKHLKLSYDSCITELPPEIGNLSSLEIMIVCENKSFNNVPNQIGNLTSLKKLFLVSNSLQTIPKEIGRLYSLDTFRIDYNFLTNLPDSIIKLTPSDFDVGNNRLNPRNLSDPVITWLDTYDPNWRDSQDTSNAIIFTPFNNSSEFFLYLRNSLLSFNLPTSGNTKLQIYNIKGILLLTLIDTYKQAGKYKIKWNSKRFSSGVYFLKLSANASSVSKKVTVVR